jgi:uncharacterized membrane protein
MNTKDDLFKYAGLGVLGGSILFVILSIIGWIIALVAFFRMPDNLESNQSQFGLIGILLY